MITLLQGLFKTVFTKNTLSVPEKQKCSVKGIGPDEPLTFDETLAQMSRGYENTQRVVQFMDAKAGVVIALCLGIFGLTGKLVVSVHTRLGEGVLKSVDEPLCYLIWSMLIVLVGVGYFGFRCLYHSFKSVRPNGLPLPEHFSTLFPVCAAPWENKGAQRYLEKVIDGQTRWYVLDEYRRQLLAMGGIVYQKISSLRTSISALMWQGLCGFLLMAIIGTGIGFGLYPKKVETPRKPIAVSIVPVSMETTLRCVLRDRPYRLLRDRSFHADPTAQPLWEDATKVP